LSFGYISLASGSLDSLDESYLLYQNRVFEIDWDAAIIGLGYATLLDEILPPSTQQHKLTFDRLFSKSVSENIADVVRDTNPDVDVAHATSHSTRGIQAADCVAGAVAERIRGEEKWFHELQPGLVDVTGRLLSRVAAELTDAN